MLILLLAFGFALIVLCAMGIPAGNERLGWWGVVYVLLAVILHFSAGLSLSLKG